jgi:hypothetical protein
VVVTDFRPLRQPPAADTLDRIDFARFTQVVRGLEAVVREISDR